MSHTQSLVPEPTPWGVVSVVGVGLIGGSLAAGLRRRGLAREVVGVGRDASRLEAAVERGLIDTATSDLAAAATRSDLLVFCTPVDRIAAGIAAAAPHCRPGTLLTDAGSVKHSICRAVAEVLPRGVEFLGGHPMAGGESQGYLAADPDLFVGRRCVLTDCGLASQPTQARLAALWRGLGARVVQLSPQEHDRLAAIGSHVPHVVAAILAGTLPQEAFPLAASGFRDTTRIAAGDPGLWTAILQANREQVLGELDRFADSLREWRGRLAVDDADGVGQLLARGQARRAEWLREFAATTEEHQEQE